VNDNLTTKPQGRSSSSDQSGFLARFGVTVSPELLRLALTHRSYAFEQGLAEHNERLEFLGDSILGQTVTLKLFADYPELPEGELAKRRASLVSAAALAEAARSINLGDYILLGKGETQTGGRDKGSILADALEAVIGAVYLDQGQEVAAQFIHALIDPLIQDPTRFTTALDPKTTLQEIAAKLGEPSPSYDVVGSGPDHDRIFRARVTVATFSGEGQGTSKKIAEIAAARNACEQYAQLTQRSTN
jgi:ribonuclease-3